MRKLSVHLIKKYNTPPLWGGKPLFKSFDKYECSKCKRVYLESNLIVVGKEICNRFCIRCYNKINKEKNNG